MTISINEDHFKNIREIWQIGTDTLVAVTANHRTIQIQACRNVRSGATPNYFAHYDELVEIQSEKGSRLEVWARDNFPWQDAEDAEKCLLRALHWVDEQG